MEQQTASNHFEKSNLGLNKKELDLIEKSVPEIENINDIEFSTKDSDELLTLTPEEHRAAAASTGMRSQIKKVLRSFRDEMISPILGLEKNQKLLHEEVKKWNVNYHKLYMGTSKRFEKQFGYLVNMFLIRLENRMQFSEIRTKAFLDETLKHLYQIEHPTKDITFEEFVDKFEKGMDENEQNIKSQLENMDKERRAAAATAEMENVAKLKEEAFGKATSIIPQESVVSGTA